MRWNVKLMPVLKLMVGLLALQMASSASSGGDFADSFPVPLSLRLAVPTQSARPFSDSAPVIRAQNAGLYGPAGYAPAGLPGMRSVAEPASMAPGAGGPPSAPGTVLSHPPGYAGVPEGSLPWPSVSPFQSKLSTHFNDNGTWFWENRNGQRRYFAGIEAMLFRLKSPDQALFGDTATAGFLGVDTAVTLGSRRGGENFFNRPFKTEGIRFHWGFWDPTDTGFELVAWWASDVFKRIHSPNGGFTVPAWDGIAGVDIDFSVETNFVYRQVAANAQITRMMHPIWKWGDDTLVLRPTYGARYFFLRERLSFDGITTTLFESSLDNSVKSQLFGPSVGLYATLGKGNFLKVTLGSKFILFVNHERQRLRGDNFLDENAPVPAFRFQDSRADTHVSPAFEQTVHFETKLFQYIPLLNRVRFLNDATLRGGLTFLSIGEVQRPNGSTEFRAWPLRPNLKTNRTEYNVFAWDVGILFEY